MSAGEDQPTHGTSGAAGILPVTLAETQAVIMKDRKTCANAV